MGLCFGFKQKRSLISFPILTYQNQAFGNVSWGARFFGSQFLFVPYFIYEHENNKPQRVDSWWKMGPCKTPVIHIKPQIVILPKKKKKNAKKEHLCCKLSILVQGFWGNLSSQSLITTLTLITNSVLVITNVHQIKGLLLLKVRLPCVVFNY